MYNNLLMVPHLQRNLLRPSLSNKDRLKHIEIIKSFLEKGSKFDLASGNLKLATFLLYITKVADCKAIVDKVLRKFLPFVIIMSERYSPDGIISSSAQVAEYVRMTDGIGLTVFQQMSSLVAYWVEISVIEKNFVPKALQYELQSLRAGEDVLLVHPFVYGYFLKSLYSHLLDTVEIRNHNIDILRQIVNTTQDSRSYHVNMNLLGYCYILAGNDREARRCFQTSLGIQAENNAASMHLRDTPR